MCNVCETTHGSLHTKHTHFFRTLRGHSLRAQQLKEVLSLLSPTACWSLVATSAFSVSAAGGISSLAKSSWPSFWDGLIGAWDGSPMCTFWRSFITADNRDVLQRPCTSIRIQSLPWLAKLAKAPSYSLQRRHTHTLLEGLMIDHEKFRFLLRRCVASRKSAGHSMPVHHGAQSICTIEQQGGSMTSSYRRNCSSSEEMIKESHSCKRTHSDVRVILWWQMKAVPEEQLSLSCRCHATLRVKYVMYVSSLKVKYIHQCLSVPLVSGSGRRSRYIVPATPGWWDD